MAIHRFFAYLAGQDPRHTGLCHRVPGIQLKKTLSNSMTYLDQNEVKTLPAVPPARHRLGLRDRALLTLLYNTGARATEMVQLNIKDLRPDTPIQVRILGKGRKERVCPRWQETADALRAYLGQRADGTQPDTPLFLNAHGRRITRSGAGTILKRNVAVAATNLASLAAKPVSPHNLRHTTALHLLQSGVTRLGHQISEGDRAADLARPAAQAGTAGRGHDFPETLVRAVRAGGGNPARARPGRDWQPGRLLDRAAAEGARWRDQRVLPGSVADLMNPQVRHPAMGFEAVQGG